MKSTLHDLRRMFATLDALCGPQQISKAALEIKEAEWLRQLQDYDPQTLMEAARSYARDNNRWPPIHGIIDACRDIRRELRGKLPEQRKTWRDDNWRPPTLVEKARVTLLAYAVKNRLGYDWYAGFMAKGEQAILAEAARVRSLTPPA